MTFVQSAQTAKGVMDDITQMRNKLTGELIGLARATEGNEHMLSDSTAAVTVEGLLATRSDANLNEDALLAVMERVDDEKRKLVPECYKCASSCGRNNAYDMCRLDDADENVRSLKLSILHGIRDVAVYTHRAAALGCRDEAVHNFLYKALFAIGMDDWETEELLHIVQEMDEVSRKCMENAE